MNVPICALMRERFSHYGCALNTRTKSKFKCRRYSRSPTITDIKILSVEETDHTECEIIGISATVLT